jgi:hypothetical protein
LERAEPTLTAPTSLVTNQSWPNQTHAVEASEVLSDPWNRIAEVGAISTNRVMTVANPLPRSTRRVHRLVTPQRN